MRLSGIYLMRFGKISSKKDCVKTLSVHPTNNKKGGNDVVNVIICTVRSQLRDCHRGNTRNNQGDPTARKDPVFVLNSITAFIAIDPALTSLKGDG